MSAYQELMKFQRATVALEQTAGLVLWDQETYMPRGAAEQRAEWLGAIEEVVHKRKSDPLVGELIASLDEEELDGTALACIRIIRRDFERRIRVPVELKAEIARVSSRTVGIWAEARKEGKTERYIPALGEIIRLKREEAAALSTGRDLYSELIEYYEPNTTTAQLTAIFEQMKSRLVALRERISASSKRVPELDCTFPKRGQIKIAKEVASAFGYDWTRGRIDFANHPFTSGAGNDVRITTRIDRTDPYNCLYSTIHETGHACYEQNVGPEHLLTPLGAGASMGVHESQSRICENQIGRSRAFSFWLYARLKREFGDIGIDDENDFYANVNRVGKGHIRTEADEVQYNLHIMLRFELERDLISGDLEVVDVEEAWNDLFRSYFGYSVDKPANGFLQDIHWADGLIGYFPTYSLGNIYAGCLHKAMRRDLQELDRDLANGDPSAAVDWLSEKVHRFGALQDPIDTVETACGFKVSPKPLLNYLDAKFAEIYDL